MSHISILLITSAIASTILSLSSLDNLAYAHTFSQNESANYLSLIERIRAEAQLVEVDLETGNLTLAQAHANNAANLIDNNTLDEIRERNNRVANTLENSLEQLRNQGLIVEPSSSSFQIASLQLKPQLKRSINQTISSLNNTLGEAATVRIDSDQRNNSTTWAMTFADIINATLKNYGLAVGVPFDLNNASNMAMMMQEGSNSSNNTNSMSMNMMNMSTSSMMQNNNIITTSDDKQPTIKIKNETAYQSAQFLANRTLLEIFNNNLKKPLANANTSTIQQQQQLINELQNSTINLKDSINNKASPNDIMMIVHTEIHPVLIQIFGLKTH